MALKPGMIVNMYNTHHKDGTPYYSTLYAKGVLLQKAEDTDYQFMMRDNSETWKDFEAWSIFVFWDRNNNSPHIQHLWLVHKKYDLSDDWLDKDFISGKQPDELIEKNGLIVDKVKRKT